MSGFPTDSAFVDVRVFGVGDGTRPGAEVGIRNEPTQAVGVLARLKCCSHLVATSSLLDGGSLKNH